MTKFLKQFFVNISQKALFVTQKALFVTQKALFVTQKSQKSQNIFSLTAESIEHRLHGSHGYSLRQLILKVPQKSQKSQKYILV